MQAVISGQAGVALLVEGEKLSWTHAGNGGETDPAQDAGDVLRVARIRKRKGGDAG